MTHRLEVSLSAPASSAGPLVVTFGEGSTDMKKASAALKQLPEFWPQTRFDADGGTFEWSEPGSKDLLAQMLEGCARHGWPFVVFAFERRSEDPAAWLGDYESTLVGVWPDRRTFAEEIAAQTQHFIEDSDALTDADVDQILTGFVSVEVDAQVLVFDLVPSS